MNGAPIAALEVTACTVPTDQPESDGTLEWAATTVVLVRARAADRTGLGYTYADAATAKLIHEKLTECLLGRDAFAIADCWQAMRSALRNLGGPGIGAMAISAVDNALWDLKARLLDVSLLDLLGAAREAVPIYGSGGFTSYSLTELASQLAGWVEQGIPRVKMKVGREPDRDATRVAQARRAIGDHAALFVDANGAYECKQALALGQVFSTYDVSWFEEPVPSADLAHLQFLRERVPPPMEITAGEYGYEPEYFRRMLEAGAIDVLQADATRCLGITGFLKAAALCEAFRVPLSSHCAPSLHAAVCCAAQPVRHLEYFHDHARLELLLFDGVLEPRDGTLRPDRTRPGFGLELRAAEAKRYAI